MIAVFLPSFPFRGKTAPYLWVFYRLLQEIKEPCLYLIGREYLTPSGEWENRSELSEEGQAHFGYQLPVPETLQRHTYELLPDAPFKALMQQYSGDGNLAFKHFLTEPVPALGEFLSGAIDKYTHSSIEAIITWCNCPTLEAIAAAKGIPVAHLELGPLRAPAFRPTGYLDFRGVNGNTEARSRFESERSTFDWNIGWSELDAFFRTSVRVDEQRSEFACAIPLQVDDDSNLIAFGNGFDNKSVVQFAHDRYPSVPVLVRPHPAAKLKTALNPPATADTSASITQFLSRASHVLTINSSVGLEAILQGIPTTILGDCSYGFVNDANSPEEKTQRLAFYLLAYLVPFDLIFNPIYLRFRLAGPSTFEIINLHISYYSLISPPLREVERPMTNLVNNDPGSDATVVNPTPQATARERVTAQWVNHAHNLLVEQGNKEAGKINEEFQLLSTHSINQAALLTLENEKTAELGQLLELKNSHIENIERQLEHLLETEETVQELKEALTHQQIAKDTHIHHLNLRIIALEGSTSWRITAPLRAATTLLKRGTRIARLIPSLIKRGGGLRPTIRKALKILKQHGIKGLWVRMRWLAGNHNLEFVGQETREVLDRHDYSVWVDYYDVLSEKQQWLVEEQISHWKQSPLISIVMPVYNAPISYLIDAIGSVQSQLYTNWELCIADDASTDPLVAETLKRIAATDARIKVVFREANGHISQASNSALELATGSYIALMDNDDLLPVHALYWIARTIIENPDVGLIYSDEDKIDDRNVRSSPYFKSGWNKFLFRSQNMICHLGAYRRDLVTAVGGFREGFEGAQDFDLALRVIEKLESSQIIHIPRILYHWRMHEGSTAMAGDEKPYAALAGVRALDEHLERTQVGGHTELLPMGMYRVHYPLPDVLPLVSLIIPTRNAHALVRQCIESITRLTTYSAYEILLVDNGSDEPASLEYFQSLATLPNVTVIRDDGPFNYSDLNNKAVKTARGSMIGLINNDIEVITPEWLSEMVSIALQPGVGAVGARLWYPDDRLQHGGVIVGVGGVAGHSHKYLPKGDYGYFCRAGLIQELSAVTAACLIIRKETFLEVNGLDGTHLKIAFNDVDFCLRVQEHGYTNVWTPFAELYHHESATRGNEDTPEKKERFQNEVMYMKSRWPTIQEDRYYNPNLTLDHEDFALAWPPRVKI